jgi:serine/threonine-protein kinase
MLAPGTLVGGWRVEHKVADGGMAEIYAAIHPIIHKRAAIKILSARLATDATAVERFVIEAQAVNRIRHPNIVDIFDCGRLDDGRLYLVMEWLSGSTLADRLWYGPRLELAQAASVLAQVCDALEAVHEAGVVHRDLKGENIFLVPRRGGGITVKLLDFGIAKLAGRARAHPTVSGVFVGTPGYVAPEQVRGADVDGRADLYAFGVTAYEVLSGRLPFDGDDGIALVRSQLRDAPRPLAEVAAGTPAHLAALVMALLSRDPDARPSLFEVRAALRALEAEARAGGRARATTEARRARSVVGAAAAVAVAAFMALVAVGAAIGRARVDAWQPVAPSAKGAPEAEAAAAAPLPSVPLADVGAPPSLAGVAPPPPRPARAAGPATGARREARAHAQAIRHSHAAKPDGAPGPRRPDALDVARDYVLGPDGDRL